MAGLYFFAVFRYNTPLSWAGKRFCQPSAESAHRVQARVGAAAAGLPWS